MLLITAVLNFYPLPSIAQEGLSLKEYIERIYIENQKIRDKLDTKLQNMEKQINENDRRLVRLEIYMWLIGVIAGGIGSIASVLILKLINRRINGNSRKPQSDIKEWKGK